ncbi:MAG: ATP-binding protein, partial [Deltaproteobacteria bacterium]|nr:ATP-binding protein [Kofleriaceae bacterium]
MLVGRDRELEELEGALARLATGVGALYLVSGEPGIGKTRLAAELVERARARGLRAAWGHCWEAGGAPALWPWREAVESLGLAFPDPASIVASDPDQARFGLFREVMAALGGDAARAPRVIVLEDLHAADHATLLLLEFVATQLRTLPLLVVATYRDLEASLSPETAGALARAGRAGR